MTVILAYLRGIRNFVDDGNSVSEQTVKGVAMITAVVPARDEEAVIAACVESLAKQSAIARIVVVNDQSRDKTAAIVRRTGGAICESAVTWRRAEPPPGWVGKNNAVSTWTRAGTTEWLLFMDADVELQEGAADGAVANCAGKRRGTGFVFAGTDSPRNGTRKR